MMRTTLAALLVCVAACGGGTAATVGTPGMGVTNVVYPRHGRVPEGTTLWVRLDTKLSAKKNYPGDGFSARVAEDIRDPNGEVLIPKNARVSGHVSDVRREYGDQPAMIFLDLDSIEIAGARQSLSGHIVATDVPSTMERIKGRDVAIGAGVGAVLGGLTKGIGGAVVGGALGAAAGTAISLGRGGTDEQLPKGTKLAVELDEPVKSLAMIRGRNY
jgi:hypothetical protein